MTDKRRAEIEQEIASINDKVRILSAIEASEDEKGFEGVDMCISCLAEKTQLLFKKANLYIELLRG